MGVAAAWVSSPPFPHLGSRSSTYRIRTVGAMTDHRCGMPTPTVALFSSYQPKNDENSSSGPVEYRSIADVVGGLHGGKYQFGGTEGTGISTSDTFSGHGGTVDAFESLDDEDLPNWAVRMAPTEFQTQNSPLLTVPSNADPMDGMVYFVSVNIQNQERTWEKFFAKLMTKGSVSNGNFVDAGAASVGLSIAPSSGFLAPRGGASNACDASKPYSDTATIHVTQSPDGSSSEGDDEDLWLVVGTEEEKWTYKLDLLKE